MSKVYVVESGERNCGGSVESVHTTAERARSAALQVRCAFGEWKVVDSGDAEYQWEAGCDYLLVKEMELDPPLLQTDEEFWNSLSDADQVEAAAVGESFPNTRTVDVARILFIARQQK